MRKRTKKKLIDTEVESAMRSNSGKKKKRNFQKEEGGGETRKEGEEKKKERKNPLRAAHNFFFLKRKSFESAPFAPPRSRRPRGAALGAEGEGRAPSPFVSQRAGCDITPSTSSGCFLLCCFFARQEGAFDFLFLQAGAEARP